MSTGAGQAPPPPAGGGDGSGTPRRDTGTSLSNLLSSTNASLANISFQPRSSGAPPGPPGGAGGAPGGAGTPTPTLDARVAAAPVFVPRGAGGGTSTPPAAAAPAAAPASAPAYAYEGEMYEPYAPDPTFGAERARHPLQYHLYAPPFPHVSNLHPAHMAAMTFFMDPALHEELERKQEALFVSGPPDAELRESGLPETLHVYHSLVPLEPSTTLSVPSALQSTRFGAQGTNAALTGSSGDPSRVFGYRTHAYKATCALDGKCYVLRRLENYRLPHESALGAAERWRRIRHPGIVAVREAFTTRAFGDYSLVFVYDYHPLATTLYMEHMTVKPLRPDRRTGRLQPAPMRVPERVLWSYACQLASVVRVVHRAGLAVRCIEPSKVLCTAQNRIRVNGCAVSDVLTYQPSPPPDATRVQQTDDLVALGRTLTCVACNNVAAGHTPEASLEVLRRQYSTQLVDLLEWLLHAGDAPEARNTETMLVRLAPAMAEELGAALNHADLLEAALMRELENGRLVRLLCKLNFINERPEFEHDPQWAETGDRYVIKLFRDMVFHAVDEHGRPVLDLSHVLVHLNKLDAGVDERLALTSRDEQTCLIVTYAEVRGSGCGGETYGRSSGASRPRLRTCGGPSGRRATAGRRPSGSPLATACGDRGPSVVSAATGRAAIPA